MKSEVTTIYEMLRDDVEYVIPQFQRAYAWRREEQWEPLWDDIVNLVQAIADSGSVAETPPHFMGPLVIQKRDVHPDGRPPGYIVVDGQQRMTTMLVLLKAVGDAADEVGMPDLAEKFHSRLWNDLAYSTWNPKVMPVNRRDRIALRSVLDRSIGTDDEGIIVDCYDFFNRVAVAYLRGWEDRQVRGQHLLDALEQKLETAVLELEASEQPNRVFETLNARAAPLKQFELVKNTVMYEGGVVEDPDRAGLLWMPDFDDGYWYQEPGGVSKLDAFLSDWLTAKLERRIAGNRVSTEFRALLAREKERRHNVGHLTHRLNYAAIKYREVDENAFGETLPSSERLLTMGFSMVMPIILWLWDLDSTVGRREKQNVLRVVESYIVRRMLMDLNLGAPMTGQLVALLPRLRAATDNEQSHGRVAREFFGGLLDGLRWPDDQEIKKKLTENPHGMAARRLGVVMSALENRLRLDKEMPLLDSRPRPTHIMPAQENLWHLGYDWPPSRGYERRKQWRQDMIAYIGNLVLTRGNLSRAAQEGHWREKLTALENHREFQLTRMLLDNPGDEWSEDAIAGRSFELAEIFIRTWPHANA